MSIKEQLKGRQYGEVIPKLEGVQVRVVYDRKTGSNDRGDWSLQDAVITDGSTELKVLFSNKPDMKHLEGDIVNLQSVSTKHGFQGVKLTKNEWEGKVNPVLRVTRTGHVAPIQVTDDAPLFPES